MSNMYGYNDYKGIAHECETAIRKCNSSRSIDDLELFDQNINAQRNNSRNSDSDDDDFLNSLAGGQWVEGDSLAPPCGSEIEAIHTLLDLANIRHDDVLYDLGCGDGRVCLEAFSPKYKCGKCVGIEIEEDLVERFHSLIEEIPKEYFFLYNKETTDNTHSDEAIHTSSETLQRHITVLRADLREIDLYEATIICLYLLPEAIALIEDKLISLLKQNPRLRILCNSWGLRSIQPIKTADVPGTTTSMFLYTIQSIKN